MVSHVTHHAAAPAACQPNSVREAWAGEAAPCVPADFARNWEDYCFEQGGGFLEEARGSDEALSSSPQTNAARSLSWRRNLPRILIVIGLTMITVKLAASRSKCAGRHKREQERA
jgi:hypothetical protein